MCETRYHLLIAITGTEQHRHNTAEVAVYSVISYLWGLEARGQYAMTKVSEVGVDNGTRTPASQEGVAMVVTRSECRLHLLIRLEALQKLR